MLLVYRADPQAGFLDKCNVWNLSNEPVNICWTYLKAIIFGYLHFNDGRMQRAYMQSCYKTYLDMSEGEIV